MTARDLDHRIATLARRQHGAFSRRQALRIGMTERMVDHRVAAGSWLQLCRSVYALPGSDGTFERQCWAAVLSEPDAALAGFTAAAVHRFAGIRPGHIEIVVPPGRGARHPFATVHRYRDPLITMVAGLPVTTAAQTLFDIAGRASLARLDRVIDDLLLTGKVTVDQLDERARCYAGTRRSGAPLLRSMLDDRRADGWAPNESELEHRLDPVLRGLPGDGRVERQQPFPWRHPAPGRVDRWLPGYGLIVEADGRRWHARLQDFDADRWRDNVAMANGVGVLRFTWVHLTQRASDARDLVISAGRVRRAA